MFFLEGDDLGFTDVIEHEIHVQRGSGPVHIPPYKIPRAYRTNVADQLNNMKRQGILKDSTSPYNAPIVVVRKKGLDKDGAIKLRICLDFRRLNDITVPDAYPLSNINELLLQLNNANYITILDLAKGFHQVKMREQDTHKTAFSFNFSHYEFIRMPFGLRNSPATFQRGLDRALLGLQGINVFCYIDDAIILAEDLETNAKKIRNVFDRFRKFNLKVQTEKCQFFKNEVVYLGHKISKDGIGADPARYEAVQRLTRPTTVKHVRQFLGLANQYRKFVKNYAMIVADLNQLLKGEENVKSNKKIIWTEGAEEAFSKIEELLKFTPILRFPNFNSPFKLETDASSTEIGGILSNEGEDGVIQFMSRSLDNAEKNYSTT